MDVMDVRKALLGLCLILFSMVAHGGEIYCARRIDDPESDSAKVFLDFGIKVDDCTTAKLEGTIEQGDVSKISNFLADNPSVIYVKLNLVGGDVNESMRIGRLLRRWSVFTFATGSDTCASSCVLIWLGGAYRDADEDHLKVHRFYILDEEFRQMNGTEIDEFYRDLTQQLRKYLSSMGVESDQDELIRSIMTTPPEDLNVVNRLSHPRLFGVPTSRDQWIRANGCSLDGSVGAPSCLLRLILRDRQNTGLLASQSD